MYNLNDLFDYAMRADGGFLESDGIAILMQEKYEERIQFLQPYIDFLQENYTADEYCCFVGVLQCAFIDCILDGYKEGFNDSMRYIISLK